MSFYGFIRSIARTVLLLVWRFKVDGVENIPASGAAIIACNHLSYFDPPALGSAANRPLFFMAKQELFERPWLAAFIRRLNAFPIDRSRGDVAAIRRSLEILQGGNVLLVFPEGGRNRDGSAHPQLGTALLAARSGAPVVPARIEGSRDPRSLAPISVRFGPALHFGTGKKATREDLANWTDSIMQSIFALSGEPRGTP